MKKTNFKTIISWLGWFIAGNTILYCLLSTRYLTVLSFSGQGVIDLHDTVLVWLYAILAILGQSFLAATGLILLGALPLLLFPRSRLLRYIWLPLVGLTGLLFIATDSTVYTLFHYHLNGVIWTMIKSGDAHEFFDLSDAEYRWLVIAILLLACAEIISVFVANWLNRLPQVWHYLRLLFGGFLTALGLSWMLYIVAIAQPFREILDVARAVPYFTATMSTITGIKGLDKRIILATNTSIEQAAGVQEPLQYPLHPLQCTAPQPRYNIVFLLIDTWRFDMLNPSVTPNLYAYALHNQWYTNHYSGGNATGPGVFSLFYSLPYSYWAAMLNQHVPPVFMQILARYGYDLKVLASGTLQEPAFNKTIFQTVPNLRVLTPGDKPYQRDQRITADALDFIQTQQRSKRPYFLFLFYDAVHGYSFPENGKIPFKPWLKELNRAQLTATTDPTPFLNRYRNALYFVDGEVNKVLKTLDPNNTIIILTGDHGEEFNDNQQNYWGHTSNFTRYQVQTPFVVHWPGQAPRQITSFSSHYDVVPFLLNHFWHCQNPISDYSISTSNTLLSTEYPFFANAYTQMGIIQPQQITTILPDGAFEIMTRQAGRLPDDRLDQTVIRQMIELTHQYFKK